MSAIALLLIIAAFIIGVLSLITSDENTIGAYGLISALPISYFLAVATVVAALFWALRLPSQPTLIMVAGVIVLVILVHGAAAFVESEARFSVAWYHAGFVDSIMSSGEARQYFDARFSWPGFFSGGAALTDLTGVSGPTVWLKWAPPVMALCYVAPLLAIGRATLQGWRAPWIGVIVFIMANWVGQDYFAPQSVAYIMYLVIMAILLTYFRTRQPGRVSVHLKAAAQRLPRWVYWPKSMIESGDRSLEPLEPPPQQWLRISLLIVVGFVTLAMVSSHQLTPLVFIMTLVLLSAVGRLRPWPLFLFVGVAFVSWLSYAAEVFWRGHIDDIFGGLGKIGSTVDSGVADRILGSPEHLNVLSDRIYFTLFVWGLAGLAVLWTWWRTRTISVPLLALTGAPVFMIVAQSYGGEGLLRVFLFSLPGAAMLIAGLVSSTSATPSWRMLVTAVVVIMMTFPFFLVAKWGNEDFERASTADLQVYQELYRIAPLGSTVVGFGLGGPSAYREIGDRNSVQLTMTWPLPPVAVVNTEIGTNPVGTYVVLVRPQIASGVINEGLPPEWGEQLVADLVASNGYRVVYQNSAGVILQQVNQLPEAAPVPAARVSIDTGSASGARS